MRKNLVSTTDVRALAPDVYAAWRASELGVLTDRLERRLILELLGELRNRSVLDVGCGDGELAPARETGLMEIRAA